MDRILVILKKENGPRASSAPALGLNTIIFKHVYWYMQQTQVSVYRTIGPLVYFSMAEVYDSSFIKSFKRLYTNLLSLPFLKNLCTVCEISIRLINTFIYITFTSSISGKTKANSYYTKMLKVNFLFSTESKI